MDKSIERILEIMPASVKNIYIANQTRIITELRLRVGFNIKICIDGNYISVKDSALEQQDLEKILFFLCDNTIPAYEDQIADGFITVQGGHRVGIAGNFGKNIYDKTVLTKIQGLNIRFSNFYEWNICDDILNFKSGLLVAGSPHSGKTTFIKSLCKKLQYMNIAVCDERSELYNKNLNNDFIINLPKHIAISQATRTLNPQIIVCDEIGGEKEAKEILSSLKSGVKFICTVHGDNIDNLYIKPNISILLKTGVFDKIVLLENKNKLFYIKEIRNV